MAGISGVGAYTAFVGASQFRVSEIQPTGEGGRSAASPSDRVVEDRVTLSTQAQDYLDVRARGAEGVQPPADLGHGNLIGADLAGRDFSGANLEGAYLFGANLRETDFSGAQLRDAWLADADATDADFRGADLRGANLSRVTGLTREQLAGAVVDLGTVLPVTVRSGN